MTDAEIIKALECCTGHHRGCNTCAYYGGERPCTQRLEADALDLIKRQQADIIMLEQNRVTFPERIKIVDNARKQAVREFVKKLKEQAFECDISFGLGSQRIRQAVAVDDIDKAVNEMFGISEQQEGDTPWLL